MTKVSNTAKRVETLSEVFREASWSEHRSGDSAASVTPTSITKRLLPIDARNRMVHSCSDRISKLMKHGVDYADTLNA